MAKTSRIMASGDGDGDGDDEMTGSDDAAVNQSSHANLSACTMLPSLHACAPAVLLQDIDVHICASSITGSRPITAPQALGTMTSPRPGRVTFTLTLPLLSNTKRDAWAGGGVDWATESSVAGDGGGIPEP